MGAERTAGNVKSIGVDDRQEVVAVDRDDVGDLERALLGPRASQARLRRTVDADVDRQRS